ncbi:pentapeptide repeat-containing protein [Pseudogracilibacillus sp. SO30301A]|uniref:pentapeptide repeat-containing protein n=1 Tax=Pseudogracilibacillus sp. SO30301A TaxID=3098291 RepID=UPI00300DD954
MNKMKQEELDLLIENHNKYIKALQNNETDGKKLMLDRIDFSNNNLSKLNFVDVYITDSIFNDTVLDGVNFGGAKIYDCKLNNMTFKNVNFGKAEFDFSYIKDSSFEDCFFTKVSSNQTLFENLYFKSCKINDVFSNSKINYIHFENCDFNGVEFWKCIVQGLQFTNSNFDVDDMIRKINKGTLDEPVIVDGEEAVNTFKEYSTGYTKS